MNRPSGQPCTAFDGSRRVAGGEMQDVAGKVKAMIERGEGSTILIFDDLTGRVIDVDFRGTIDDVLARLKPPKTMVEAACDQSGHEPPAQRGPGRPRLGVVAREVTLLPRHWEWLNSQPGGASVALRKLVEEARKVNSGRDRLRQAKEAAYRFMSAMAGDLPGFEEASRALFADAPEKFRGRMELWPTDIRDHLLKLSIDAFPTME